MASTNPPLEWSENHPDFIVEEWEPLGHGRLSAQDASRHFFVVGETGSGKTKSAVMPLLRAALHYPTQAAFEKYAASQIADGEDSEEEEDLRPAILVIDPKHELGHYAQILEKEISAQPGIQAFRDFVWFNLDQPNKHIFWLFEGVDVIAMNASEVADRLLEVTSYAEREKHNRNDPFWGEQASGLLKSILEINHHVFKQGGVDGLKEFWGEVHFTITNKLVSAHNQMYAQNSGKAAEFQATYDQFNETLKQLRDGAFQLASQFDDEALQLSLATLKMSISRLSQAQDDMERGRTYDAIIDEGRVIAAWCNDRIAALQAQDACPAQVLIQFQTNLEQLNDLGEKLMRWNSDAPDSRHFEASIRRQPLRYDRANYLRPIFTLFDLSAIYHRDSPPSDPIFEGFVEICRDYNVDPQLLNRLQMIATLADRTYSSIAAVIQNFLQESASPELAQYVSLNPYEAPESAQWLSIQDRINAGDCVVYSPGTDTNLANLVGRTLKAKFFELMFQRRDRIRPFVYICDEFQRYVTADRKSGEQSFLDRCRAYRGICVLATQSMASLDYRLIDMEGDVNKANKAVQIMLNNTGNKFFFRNTDAGTQDLLLKLMPGAPIPDRPHVVNVHTVSSLEPGECYYLFSNGQNGIGQVQLPDDTFARAQRHTREQEARTRFKEIEKALKAQVGAGWETVFKAARSYQQLWKPEWDIPSTIWVHFELYFSKDDLLDAGSRFEMLLHVEREKRGAFLETFRKQREKEKNAKVYDERQIQFFPSDKRVIALASKMYTLEGDLEADKTQFVTALEEFAFLIPLVDKTLKSLKLGPRKKAQSKK